MKNLLLIFLSLLMVSLLGMQSIQAQEPANSFKSQFNLHFEYASRVLSLAEAMPDSKLQEKTELYGRTVKGQAVLMQLITHMREHVGKSVAYARMNGIVPPWSE